MVVQVTVKRSLIQKNVLLHIKMWHSERFVQKSWRLMHMICFHKAYDVVGWIWSEIWHLFHPHKCGVLHMNNFPLQYLKMVLCCVLCANRVWGDHFAMFLHDLFPPNLLFYYYFQFIYLFLQSRYISPRESVLKADFEKPLLTSHAIRSSVHLICSHAHHSVF